MFLNQCFSTDAGKLSILQIVCMRECMSSSKLFRNLSPLINGSGICNIHCKIMKDE